MSSGNDSNVVFGRPDRGKEASTRPARGRICVHQGCATVLSTYNAANVCWLHTPTVLPRRPKPE
jgi:hypothetical protein